MKGSLSFACAILLAAGTAAYAQENTTTSQPDPSMQSSEQQPGTTTGANTGNTTGTTERMAYSQSQFRRDIAFNTLHHLNMSVVEVAKLGQEKASSPEVKNFATTLQKDHEAAEQKLMESARGQNIQLDTFSPATFQVAAWDELKKLQGNDFDRAFMDYVKTSHDWNAESMKRIEKDTKDPAIKAQVSSMRPTFDEHYKMAKSIKLPGSPSTS